MQSHGALVLTLAVVLELVACRHDRAETVAPTALENGASEVVEEASPAHPRTAPGIWWNQPRFIEALRLTDTQRRDFDGLLEQYRIRRQRQMASFRQSQQERADALSSGQWEEARQAGEDLAEAAAELSRDETELYAAVLRRLDAEQRTTLAESFPVILRRPWMIGGGGGRFAPAAARRR